mmetsp:Transcript_33371/g.89308  ORF Transcript_33371/g.89308 Transcript_33371/m.89308 type:complete len:90 (+) Transcript_33371:848-1117(+)
MLVSVDRWMCSVVLKFHRVLDLLSPTGLLNFPVDASLGSFASGSSSLACHVADLSDCGALFCQAISLEFGTQTSYRNECRLLVFRDDAF